MFDLIPLAVTAIWEMVMAAKKSKTGETPDDEMHEMQIAMQKLADIAAEAGATFEDTKQAITSMNDALQQNVALFPNGVHSVPGSEPWTTCTECNRAIKIQHVTMDGTGRCAICAGTAAAPAYPAEQTVDERARATRQKIQAKNPLLSEAEIEEAIAEMNRVTARQNEQIACGYCKMISKRHTMIVGQDGVEYCRADTCVDARSHAHAEGVRAPRDLQWKTSGGEVLYVRMMTGSHLLNALRVLIRRAHGAMTPTIQDLMREAAYRGYLSATTTKTMKGMMGTPQPWSHADVAVVSAYFPEALLGLNRVGAYRPQSEQSAAPNFDAALVALEGGSPVQREAQQPIDYDPTDRPIGQRKIKV